MAEFHDLVNSRRTVYGLGSNTDVTAEKVTEVLSNMAPKLPSAMNIQSTRLVVISGEVNKKVWELIDATQQQVMSEEMYAKKAPVYAAAKKAPGTVLFWESRNDVNSMPTRPARAQAYKENNHAIAAYATWLALTELGLGASLQHVNVGYEQGSDKEIRELLDLPDDWEMLAQMPFGSIEAPAVVRPSKPADELVRHITDVQ